MRPSTAGCSSGENWLKDAWEHTVLFLKVFCKSKTIVKTFPIILYQDARRADVCTVSCAGAREEAKGVVMRLGSPWVGG